MKRSTKKSPKQSSKAYQKSKQAKRSKAISSTPNKSKSKIFKAPTILKAACLTIVLIGAVYFVIGLSSHNKSHKNSDTKKTAPSVETSPNNNVTVVPNTTSNSATVVTGVTSDIQVKIDGIILELNAKRAENGRSEFVQDDNAQTIAESMSTSLVNFQYTYPTTKVNIDILDKYFAEAGGNRKYSIYTTSLGEGCSTDATTIANGMYGFQDSHLRNPIYKKIGFAIGNLDWGCNYIAVLSE